MQFYYELSTNLKKLCNCNCITILIFYSFIINYTYIIIQFCYDININYISETLDVLPFCLKESVEDAFKDSISHLGKNIGESSTHNEQVECSWSPPKLLALFSTGEEE